MSIHGFMDQNGQIQKYDYTDLENKPTIPAEVLIDDTLTEEGQAADAKAVGDAIANIEPGLSSAAKQALLEIFQHVAYIDENGQDYYDALENALAGGQTYTITLNLTGCESSNTATSIIEGHTYFATITADSGYTLDGATATATMGGQTVTGFYNNGTISIPNVTGDLVITVTATSSVASISAVFTQGSAAIYNTDTLDTLKQYLTVTATYADSTTATVTDYTLSGALIVGTSIITVGYGGKTDTFNVTVKERTVLSTIPIAWNTASGSQVTISGSNVTVKGNGTGWPNAVLNNLLYQLSQTTGKRVHIIGDVVVSGLNSGLSYQCICGLFPNQNPSTMSNRIVSGGGGLSPSMSWPSNGTYHFDSVFYPQEETAWESYSGYVGIVVFGNTPNSGASAKFSNMKAYLEDA